MEVLVVAIAELVTLLIPVMLALVEAAALAVSFVLELTALVVELITRGSWQAARKARKAKRQAKPDQSESAAVPAAGSAFVRFFTSPIAICWMRRATIVSGLLLAVTLVIVLALNFLFFERFVRVALGAAERHNSIVATFQAADGNLFTGRINLRGARFVRQGHAISDFDLKVDRLDLDADVTELVWSHVVFEDVTVNHVRGQYAKTGKRDPALPRRQFTVARLMIDDVQIEVEDRSRPPRIVQVPLEITSLRVDDFRSRWAAFDVLFRSTCRGKLAGQTFEITNQQVGAFHETVWKGRSLPIHVLGDYFGGPLAWLVDGRLDIDMTTKWRPDEDDPELEMRGRLSAHDFAAQVPPEFKIVERALVEPAIAFLNRNPANLPLDFELVMRKNAFEGRLSLFTAGVLEAIGDAAGRELKQLLPNARGGIDEAVNRFRARVQQLTRPIAGDPVDEAPDPADPP